MSNRPDGCYCHLNPPCGYCMEKYECAKCSEIKHPQEDGAIDIDTDVFCEECFEDME